jgi:hypothetical protein
MTGHAPASQAVRALVAQRREELAELERQTTAPPA